MKYPIMQSNREPLINAEKYNSMYQYSIDSPDDFWAEQAEKFVSWNCKWDKVSDVDFSKGNEIRTIKLHIINGRKMTMLSS